MATAIESSDLYEEVLPDHLRAQVADPAALSATVADALAAGGVTLGGPLQVDPVPRVLSIEEWQPLAIGLCQRVRALDRFLADVYGRQCIIREGVVPAAAVASAAYFEPLMQQAATD